MKNKKGEFETIKFQKRRKSFYRYTNYLEKEKIPTQDILEHFSAYVGHMSLNRVLTLYEFFKMTRKTAGHIAEVGVYKGAGSILFAKLLKIFQSESLTQVHGFDWFNGASLGENDTKLTNNGDYKSNFYDLKQLIKKQNLKNIIKLHKLDIRKELEDFFKKNLHLQFRLVFLDAGQYEVMKKAIPAFWERLTPGGIMIFDHYSHELAPSEAIALREVFHDKKILTLENSWMPNAYVIKE